MPASTSSTPPTSIPKAMSEELTGRRLANLGSAAIGRRHRHQGARRSRPGPERPRRFARPHHGRDRGEPEAARHSTTSTSTRSTASTRRRRSRRPCARSTTSSAQGNVRYVGVLQLAGVADHEGARHRRPHGWRASTTLQAYYTIAGRDLEREIVPLLADQKVGLMVWSPLAGGLLTGKFDRDGKGPDGARRATFDFPPVDKDRAFAVRRRHAPDRATRTASRSRASRSPGCCTQAVRHERHHRRQDRRAARRQPRRDRAEADAEELATLDEVSALPPEYPGWMIERQNAQRRPA